MRERCPDHKLLGQGLLRAYRWIISSRGYATIVNAPSDYVCGLVYSISQSDEDTLDEKEGVHSGSYFKHTISVDLGGSITKCLVYIDPVEADGKPNSEYIKRINKGIADAKLPSDYVDQYIRKFIPA